MSPSSKARPTAWHQLYTNGPISKIDDLDVVEVHDCFTIAELLIYEAMGLAEKGDGARAIAEGWSTKQGKLPVNPSGGLKSKGHPDRCHRRIDACDGGNADPRRRRRASDKRRRNCRRLQYGGLGCRQLRHPFSKPSADLTALS
jgi:hypothetical protein